LSQARGILRELVAGPSMLAHPSQASRPAVRLSIRG
jgi:hypothetical protein